MPISFSCSLRWLWEGAELWSSAWTRVISTFRRWPSRRWIYCYQRIYVIFVFVFWWLVVIVVVLLLLSLLLLLLFVFDMVLTCIQLGNFSRCVSISPLAHICSSCVNAVALSSYMRLRICWPNKWCTSLLSWDSGTENDVEEAPWSVPFAVALARMDCCRERGNENSDIRFIEDEEAEVCVCRLLLALYKLLHDSSYLYFSMCANVRLTFVIIPCSFTYKVAIYSRSDTMHFLTDRLWCSIPDSVRSYMSSTNRVYFTPILSLAVISTFASALSPGTLTRESGVHVLYTSVLLRALLLLLLLSLLLFLLPEVVW